jgi:hypothetical protein
VLEMINNKKADFGFSNIVMIVLAIIGGLLIISIVAYILGAFTDPNRIEEGIGCRIMIQSTSRIEEGTSGFITADKLLKACKVIETTIPRKQNYPLIAGNVNKMTAEQFKKVVMYDFAELVNNAWWISGEGERADYLIKKIGKVFLGENNCRIFYAVKVHAPNSRLASNFAAITLGQFLVNLRSTTRADIKGGSLAGDQRSVLTYVSLDNQGAGVMFPTLDENKSVITLSQGGADAIYAIAVGFVDETGLTKFWKQIFKENEMVVNTKASFIYIAPWEEVTKICTVSN